MWIRNPWCDGFWFLSGFPLALALVLVSAWSGLRLQNVFIFFAVVMTLDTIHRIAPIQTAWTHHGFRRVMVKRPMKFVALPVVLLGAGVAAGFASQAYWPAAAFVLNNGISYVPAALSANPLVWFMVVHYVWNIWHFAMQNFGVMQIYRGRSGVAYPNSQRTIDRTLFLGIQIAIGIQVLFSLPSTNWLTRYPPAIETNHVVYVLLGIAALAIVVREAAVSGKWHSPRILFAASQMIIMFTASGLWVVVISSFNHWFAAIGLAGHIDGNRRRGSPLPAVCGVSILGAGLAVLLFFTPYLRVNFFAALLGFGAALGIVHFLYDRWLYKLSDARVAATIGSDMFCLDAGHPR
jgi:hypothetical protein